MNSAFVVFHLTNGLEKHLKEFKVYHQTFLRFIECYICLVDDFTRDQGLIHYLLDQSVIDWSEIIWVIICLQNCIQNSVTKIEARWFSRIFNQMRDHFEPEFMLKILFEFFADKNQELQNFDCVLSQM